MADRLPLAEASSDEILARTVYQIIREDYRLNPDCYDNPATRLFDLAFQWRQTGLTLIAEQIELAAIWCAQGSTVRQWLTSRISPATGRSTILARAAVRRRR